MGRRRFSVEDNSAVTFDSRCLRSDGRRWRCPMPALPNNIFCVLHRTPSTRRRANAVDLPSKLSDSELPQLDPDPIAESDPEKVHRNEDPLPRRRKKKRKRENGVDAEESTLDPSSDQVFERDSNIEKLNRNLKPVETEKKRARKENGAESEVTTLDGNSDLPVEADSDFEKVNRVLDPVQMMKKRLRKENGADLEGTELHSSSDQPVEADLDLEKANRFLDPPAASKKNHKKHSGAHSEPSTLDCNSDLPIETEKKGLDLEKANQTSDLNKKKQRREKGESRKREKKVEMIGDKETDLIRIAMKRQMEKREEREDKKRSETQMEEVRRELPNGVMAISSTPTKILNNVDRIVDKKIGLGSVEGGSLIRRFRSKNVEPQPVGSVKKFPRVLGRSKTKCGEKKMVNGVKKSCKTGKLIGAEDSVVEESAIGQNKSGGIRCADYFVSQLLPVLKQLNWEQIFELEIEASSQGRGLSGIQLQVMECSHDVLFKCNFCRTSIVNLHRSCSKCHYRLCPSCCQEIRGENLPEGVNIVACEHAKQEKYCKNVTETADEIRNELSLESPIVHIKSDKKSDVSIPCPPSALGGCADSVLDMKLLVPFGWTQKTCITKQTVSNFDPEGCANSV